MHTDAFAPAAEPTAFPLSSTLRAFDINIAASRFVHPGVYEQMKQAPGANRDRTIGFSKSNDASAPLLTERSCSACIRSEGLRIAPYFVQTRFGVSVGGGDFEPQRSCTRRPKIMTAQALVVSGHDHKFPPCVVFVTA